MENFNPSNPDMFIYILHTVLCAFLIVLKWRIVHLAIKRLISSILMSFKFDMAVILLGETRCQSVLVVFRVNLLIIGNACRVIFLSEQDKKITYHLAYSLKSSNKLLHLSSDNGN